MAVGTKIINAFVAYEFIKLLSRPFNKTKAYELGIIDDKGNVLRKRRELKTDKEKKAYTVFHTLVWNIKKLLAKVGVGKSTLASFAAALYLIKEECEKQEIKYEPIELAFLNVLHDTPNQYLLEDAQDDDDVNILPAGEFMLTITLTLDDGFVVRAGDEVVSLKSQGPVANILGINLFNLTHKDSGREITVSHKDLKRTEQ